MADSAGLVSLSSCRKSPNEPSSLSPTGVSRLTGCFQVFMMRSVSFERHPDRFRQLLHAWISPGFLANLSALRLQLRDALEHVHGNANRTALIGDRAGDGLTNPPGRIRRELVSAAILVLVDARIKPALPSWIRSRKLRPRLRYFLAIDTTSRKLPPDRCCLASVQPSKRFLIRRSDAETDPGSPPASARTLRLHVPEPCVPNLSISSAGRRFRPPLSDSFAFGACVLTRAEVCVRTLALHPRAHLATANSQ